RAAVRVALAGNSIPVVAVDADLRPQVARVGIGGDDDAAFDQHLVDRPDDHRDQFVYLRDLLRDVADHQRVGALVGHDHAALGQEAVLALPARPATAGRAVVADALCFGQGFEDRFGAVVVDLDVVSDQVLALFD